MQALIFDIKKFSINDGPGIRTTIFFKGCPLSCLWCHNPESRSRKSQIIYYKDKCIKCGECAKVCKNNAILLDEEGIKVNEKCSLNTDCVNICPTDALEIAGKLYYADEILEIILKDKIFFEESGGGVTFSGGEPLNQSDFLLNILKKCKEYDIHTAVDTTGYTKLENLIKILPFTDLFLYDLKHLDNDKHFEITGVSNSLILKNLEALLKNGANIRIRIPVIPNINDNENLIQTAKYVSQIGIKNVDLLPYHNIMLEKYERLEMQYLLKEISPPKEEYLNDIKAIFEEKNLEVSIGG